MNRSLIGSTLSLIRDTYRVVGHRLSLLIGLTVANAVSEGLTLAMLLPLLTVLGVGGTNNAGNVIIVSLQRLFNAVGLTITPQSLGVMFLLLMSLSAAIFVAQSYLSVRLQTRYVAYWQRRLFAAVVAAGWPFLGRQRPGDIVAGLTTEALRLGGAFYQANLIASSLIFLLVQVVIAALIAPAVTGAMLLLAALLFVATHRLVRRAMTLGAQLTQANSDLYASAGELVGAMKLVKATAHEEQAKALLGRDIDRIESLSFSNFFDVQMVRAIFEYASGAAVALFLITGPLLFGIDAVSVLIVVAIFVRMFPKVTGLRQCVQSIGQALPAFDTLQSLTAAADNAREKFVPVDQAAASGPAAVRLDDVCLRGPGNRAILDGISLDVAPGTFVAIVGETGAGKTSLIDCVLGLVTPSSGQVLIDGRPLTTIGLAAWRRTVGYLGQDPLLLAGSLRDNIRWGRSDVDDTAIADALRAAGAGFAFRLPHGVDADMAGHLSRLSGGERQRIALARALVGQPRLLILDEVTSALDVETERNVVAALAARRTDTTVLAVTHRAAVARAADWVVMLERGRIVAQGAFATLQVSATRFGAVWADERDSQMEMLAGADRAASP